MQPDFNNSLPPNVKLLVPDLVPQPFVFDNPAPSQPPDHPDQTLRIRLPSMAPSTRSATRPRTTSIASAASGSEYHESNASMDVDGQQGLGEDDPEEEKIEYGRSQRGRKIIKKSYVESASEDDPAAQGDELNVLDQADDPAPSKMLNHDAEGDEDGEGASRYRLRDRTRLHPRLNGTIVSDEDGEANVKRYDTRSRGKQRAHPEVPDGSSSGRLTRRSARRSQHSRHRTRPTRQSVRDQHDEEDFVNHSSSGSADADGSLDEGTPEPELDEDADAEGDVEEDGDVENGVEQDGRKYALRQRVPINYAIPPPLEEMKPPPKPRSAGGRTNGRGGMFGGGRRNKGPGWSASGAELSRWMGGNAGDDSDSDYASRTPRKSFGVGAGAGGGVFAGGAGNGAGLFPSDLAAAAGTPSNLGKVGDASLADTDPLGVNQNVTFDEVGGLDDHINSLKEMTLLPLLYPEVFQRFNVTPPRGVLFHGPPGTGKTLLARALAASCRSNGKGISFFMRKGADCLSKWVGEAERQLRLLFEEARNQQPSIIFFDEIDGLAPVRSSKQDQIHASIVSTLLALMDGMDGRGQVVVIGATNRPDAIDPALRRPGRFDREFYFPLPGLDARERILRIMTRQWAGWGDRRGEDNVKGLAKLTKGYGGADLRALCTEAALNAVQRRYPQIYKSSERLLLDPTTIDVELRDFMISVKKLIPSSARATASAASPIPTQLAPLLDSSLEKMKEVINKVLPISKKRTALEEAEWEDEGDEGALEREMMMQTMETLRVYRPRVVLHGLSGMGQSFVAAAALHHLEGHHVQSLDLGTLLSDSTRTPEAAIVQLFVEAKRHQPSVIYIPSLTGWCAAVSETSRATVSAMLETLAPTDPVLFLAVVDGPFQSLPRDVRAWFGSTRDNRVELVHPTSQQREQFFGSLLQDIGRPPNKFPDGIKRKKRVLEDLPIAPPLAPRVPTAAELAVQEESDRRVFTLLKYRLGPILTELKRKFKRFTKRATDEYNFDDAPVQVETAASTVGPQTTTEGEVMAVVNDRRLEGVNAPVVNGINEEPIEMQIQVQPQLFDMDLERMHVDLYRSKYLTPDEFLDDIRKIVHNANVGQYEDLDRLHRAQAMLTAAEVSIQDFDPHFRLECQRMALRERRRREELRKSKGKGRAAEEGGQNGAASQVYLPGTRRSARHNGLQPEIAITDPLQLERKLKRQRSLEASQEQSEDEADGHAAKRSRVSSSEVDEHQAVDVSLASPSQRLHAVRFADRIEHVPSSPSPHSNEPVSDLQRVELPRRPPGFEELLNPLRSPENPHAALDAFNRPVNVTSSSEPQAGIPQLIVVDGLSHPQLSQPPAPESSVDSSDMDADMNGIIHDEGAVAQDVGSSQRPAEELMQIARSPTPLPDFKLKDKLLSDLARDLRETTGSLNVEQLEQLRATCLGAVWRHRTDWDRTDLIIELQRVVKSFVEDVSVNEMDVGSTSW